MVRAEGGEKETACDLAFAAIAFETKGAAAKPEPPVCEADKLQVPAETKVKTKPETVQTVEVEDEIVTGKPLDEEATSV